MQTGIYLFMSERLSPGYVTVVGTVKPDYDGFVDMHTHLEGDTASSPKNILKTARARGLTGIVVTNHDSTSGFRRYQDINTNLGLGLDIFPGVESTALVPDARGALNKSKPKHVLVIWDKDRQPPSRVPCYMPAAELNEFAHNTGARTSAAHLNMGGFSITSRELRDIQDDTNPQRHFDYVEVHHGGVLNLLRAVVENPKLTKFLRSIHMMPHPIDTNAATQAMLAESNGDLHLKGVTSGSDSHSIQHIGDVGIRYPRQQGLFAALDSGNFAVVQRKDIRPPWTLREVIFGTFGGWKMEVNRRLGRNGFAIHQANS